jgi:polysaccharide deacetylase 2 family uncharacterized protein YibQ
MRGFFGGLIIGLVTIVIAVVALSLLVPVSQPGPSVSDGTTQPATGQVDPQAGVATMGADNDLVELAPTVPGAQQGGQDDLNALKDADTDTTSKPNVSGATADLADPTIPPQAPDVEAGRDTVVTLADPSVVPNAPTSEKPPAAVSEPAAPIVPDVVPGVAQAGAGTGGTGTGGTETGATSATQEPLPVITTNSDPAPSSVGAGSVSTAPTADPAADTAPEPATQPGVPPTQQAGKAVVEAAPVPADEQTSVPSAQTDDSTAPQIAALPQAGAETGALSPTVGTRVLPLIKRDAVPEPEDQPSEVASDAAGGPLIEINAVPFENPGNLPVMAIVLIDDGDGLGGEALAGFPYPLTFAVDPADPDAAAKMARHRAAGFEVVALVNLPNTATAQDAEVNLSVWLENLPEVVGLLEGTGTGFQGNRDLSDQVTAIVSSAGLGLIMQAKGLNTAYKLAARDGVPAGLVFRDFDGAGQTTAVMRRFLDQAAFRAGQQGGVIMLGRLRPDTISTLLLWGLQDRASRVALAPVSAVLVRAP